VAICLAITGGTFYFFRKRKQKFNTVAKPPGPTPATIPLLNSSATQENLKLKIEFPLIRHPFPDIWGIGEKFKAEIHLTKDGSPLKGEITLQVDNEPTQKIQTNEQGIVTINLQKNMKGTYLLTAKYSNNADLELVVNRGLKIVDYTEEIVGLFKDFFSSEINKGTPVNHKTTPREFQTVLQTSYSLGNHAPLEKMISIFEIADYSLYNLSRADYELMFLSALTVKETSRTNKECD
jgi:hypothetical protein